MPIQLDPPEDMPRDAQLMAMYVGTNARLKVLRFVKLNPGSTAGYMAETMGMALQTVRVILRELEALGYVIVDPESAQVPGGGRPANRYFLNRDEVMKGLIELTVYLS